MQSPFPGMDPFIEASDLWGDFHANLIADLTRSLSKIVPKRYVVRINSRSYLAIDEILTQHFRRVRKSFLETFSSARAVKNRK